MKKTTKKRGWLPKKNKINSKIYQKLRFLGINSSLLRFEILSGFLFSFFYKMLSMNRLEFSCFADYFLNQRRVWFLHTVECELRRHPYFFRSLLRHHPSAALHPRQDTSIARQGSSRAPDFFLTRIFCKYFYGKYISWAVSCGRCVHHLHPDSSGVGVRSCPRHPFLRYRAQIPSPQLRELKSALSGVKVNSGIGLPILRKTSIVKHTVSSCTPSLLLSCALPFPVD
jgi:hypothetical protein